VFFSPRARFTKPMGGRPEDPVNLAAHVVWRWSAGALAMTTPHDTPMDPVTVNADADARVTAVIFLRWYDRDAHTIVPSLFAENLPGRARIERVGREAIDCFRRHGHEFTRAQPACEPGEVGGGAAGDEGGEFHAVES